MIEIGKANENFLILFENQVSNINRLGDITDQGLKNMNESLRRLTSLHSLSLGFFCCEKVTDEGVKSLSDGLKSLTSLQSISLTFHSLPKITDQGLKGFGDSLKRLSSLQSISIPLQSYQR